MHDTAAHFLLLPLLSLGAAIFGLHVAQTVYEANLREILLSRMAATPNDKREYLAIIMVA